MNWIDAIIEMKKDNSKVFQIGDYKVKIENGRLIQHHKADGWQVRMIGGKEQLADWVEVKQFKEVDYAEFMEWYCNPNNRGKEYKGIYKCNQVPFIHLNNLDHPPRWFSCDVHGYQIPNE